MSHKLTRPIITVVVIAVAAILIGLFAFLYHPPSPEISGQSWLEDPENDLEFTGERYLGMVDVARAEVNVEDSTLNLTITVKDTVPNYLNTSEFAQWMTTVVLLDEYQAYDLIVEINSTKIQGELTGYFRELGSEQTQPCTVERSGNQLLIRATLNGLQDAREIRWSIMTAYEKWSDASPPEVVESEFDSAPDEGFQTTIIKK